MVFTPERMAATVIVALVLTIAWRYADREGREGISPSLVLNGFLALLIVVAFAGAWVYAQGVTPPDTNNCCVVWVAGSPWCIGWWCAYVASILPVL